jgi:hypothetical protein
LLIKNAFRGKRENSELQASPVRAGEYGLKAPVTIRTTVSHFEEDLTTIRPKNAQPGTVSSSKKFQFHYPFSSGFRVDT